MKYLFLTFFICISGLLSAQITVDKGDMPIGGYTARISIADTLFQPDLQSVGANVTWDFSSLSHLTQRRDSFINANGVPFLIRLFFTSATVVRVQETPDSLGGIALSEAFYFFRASNDKYESQGLGATISGVPIGLKNNPSDVIYRFPMNFGDADSSDALAQLNIPGLFYIERSIKRWNEVDAWGNLTTPYGNFNVLRVKSTIQESDSIAADTIQFRVNVPTRREYKWLAKEERIPVLTVNTVLVGNNEVSAGIQYVDSLRNTRNTTGIPAPISSVAKLYPNPSTDQIKVQLLERLGEDARLEVFSMEGKKIIEKKLFESLSNFSLGHLPKGMYQVVITSSKGRYSGSLLLR